MFPALFFPRNFLLSLSRLCLRIARKDQYHSVLLQGDLAGILSPGICASSRGTVFPGGNRGFSPENHGDLTIRLIANLPNISSAVPRLNSAW